MLFRLADIGISITVRQDKKPMYIALILTVCNHLNPVWFSRIRRAIDWIAMAILTSLVQERLVDIFRSFKTRNTLL